MDDTNTLIRAVLAEHGRLSVDAATLAETDDLHEAGLSSHATVSVMVALEDALEIEFPDRLLNRRTFESISSLRDAIASLSVSA
jgi:acyl carrier protein